MRTLARITALLLAALLPACIDWAETRRAYCLDGGSGCRPEDFPDGSSSDEDGGEDGGSDAGFDAGDTFKWDGGRVLRAVPPTVLDVQVGTTLQNRLEVELIWEDGGYASDVEVTFTADQFGPTASFPGGNTTSLATTGASGRARAQVLTAGTSVGSYSVTATAVGFPDAGAVFSLRNVSGPPQSFQLSGEGQSVSTRMPYPTPIFAYAQDQYLNAVRDIEVRFTSLDSGVPVYFDDAGVRTIVRRTTPGSEDFYFAPVQLGVVHAGSEVGQANLRAELVDGGLVREFSLFVSPGPPYALYVLSNTTESAPLGGWFPPISFYATDDAGYRITGNAYLYSPFLFDEPYPASCYFSTSGYYEAYPNTYDPGTPFRDDCRAIGDAGTYQISVQVSPATATLTFTNTPPPASMIVLDGDGQATPLNAFFDERLTVRVTDQAGQPVKNARVKFEVQTRGAGPSATFEGATGDPYSELVFTESTGIATSARLLANDIAGGYTASATLIDFDNTPPYVTFDLTNQ